MSRFQIEDIVEQDKHGVVFRALDTESGQTVAIRRFLPFGPEGGGLENDEKAAFESAAMRMAGVSHIALRSIIAGSVDPIDGIPFLVTEWVEGISLGESTASEKMDPANVISLLRTALEVSVSLSDEIGVEAVWVETEVDSIIVGTEDSGRSFAFWICPFKWIGADMEARKLSSIVDLGEELMGWKRRIVSAQSGQGLGGWFKWLKKNPDACLGEALEMLASFTGEGESSAEAVPVEPAIKPQQVLLSQPSAKKPLVFSAVALLLVIPAAFFYMRNNDKQEQIAANPKAEEVSPEIERATSQVVPKAKETPPAATDPQVDPGKGEPAPEETAANSPDVPPMPAPPEPAEPKDAAARANALAEKLSKEAAARDEALAAAARQKALAAAAKAKLKPVAAAPGNVPADPNKIYGPEDRAILADIKMGTPVKLQGTIRSIGQSGTKKTLYLFFSNPPDKEEVAVAVHKGDFKDEFDLKTFLPYLGKEIVISGTCFKELNGRVCVKILARDQIQRSK